MDDGGMGSLLFSNGSDVHRRFGLVLAESQFMDEDGIPVMAALNLDDQGELYELDLWKVDFSPLKRLPR